MITRFTSVLQILNCSKRRYFQLITGERVENLARWSRLCTTTVEMFQGSWSYFGLEWRLTLARHSVEGGVVLILRPSFCPSQRARSWSSGAEIHSAPTAAFNISDGMVTIDCAYVAKLTHLGSSGINPHAPAGAYGCRVRNIQWAGTVH